jgi:hypothetical protein
MDKNLRKSQTEILESKVIISETENSLEGFKSSLNRKKNQ